MRRFSRKSRFGESKGFRPETYRLLSSFPQKDVRTINLKLASNFTFSLKLTETDESATLESLRLSHQETLIVETGGDESE